MSSLIPWPAPHGGGVPNEIGCPDRCLHVRACMRMHAQALLAKKHEEINGSIDFRLESHKVELLMQDAVTDTKKNARIQVPDHPFPSRLSPLTLPTLHWRVCLAPLRCTSERFTGAKIS